ncbi:hypothetical protein HY839_01775 [Candidatus Azambacteria bacterium]|nr:hypothetical protein [Candidatus Azambacteria bacterium]
MEEEATQEQEDAHAQSLRQARTQNAKGEDSKSAPISDEEIEKLEKLAANREKIVTFVLTPIIAGGNALLNYIGIGSIPILGDVIDLGAGAALSGFLFTLEGHPRWKAQLLVWGLTAVELIPAADIVSPQAIGAGLALFIAWRAGTAAQEKLDQLRGA